MDEREGPEAPPAARKPGKKPPLRIVRSKIPAGHRVMTRELYDAAESYWLKSERSNTKLALHIGCSLKMANRLVNKGYANKSWAPLKERARLYDLQASRAREVAQSKALEEEASELARAKRDNLIVVRNLRAMGMAIAARINALVSAVPQHDGARLTDRDAMTKTKALAPAALVLRQVSTSLKDLSEAEMKWIKGAEPEKEGEARQGAEALLAMTSGDWLEFTRSGRLPPNMPPDALKELAKLGFQVPGARPAP